MAGPLYQADTVIDAPLDYMPYSDGTYNYYCLASPGTALTAEGWQISRRNLSTGRVEYANGGAFNNAATDLAAVQGAFA